MTTTKQYCYLIFNNKVMFCNGIIIVQHSMYKFVLINEQNSNRIIMLFVIINYLSNDPPT